MKIKAVLGFVAMVGGIVFLHVMRLMADDVSIGPPDAKPGDLDTYHFPAWVFVRDSLLAGRLPLWNPYQLAGTPFVALNITMPFYPLLLIFLPLPPEAGIVAHFVLHVAIAAVFTWLFARRIGLECFGAAAATLGYSLSHAVAIGAFSTPNVSNLAWLPAILWALHGLATKAVPRRALMLALVVAMSYLSGFAQGFLYSVQLGALYTVFLLASPVSKGQRIRFAGWLAVAGPVTAALVAPQLLPALDLASTGVRNLEGVPFDQAVSGGGSLFSGVMNQALLGLTDRHSALPKHFLIFAVLGLAMRRHRLHAAFFAVTFLLAWDFMKGEWGVVFPIYFDLPAGNLFRIPLRMGFVYSFCAAMLIGTGASHLANLVERHRSLLVGGGLALLALMAWEQNTRSIVPFRYGPLVAADLLQGPPGPGAWARKFAGTQRVFVERWWNHSLPIKIGMMQQFFVVPDYEPILPSDYARFFGFDEHWHSQLQVTHPPQNLPFLHQYTRPAKLYDLLSVEYYLDARSYDPANPLYYKERDDLKRRVRGHQVKGPPLPIYRREQALPRTYIVHEASVQPSEEAAIQLIREPKQRFDPVRTVVVSEAVTGTQPLRRGASEFSRIEEFEANRVLLRARCESTCIVVLTDLFDPDWITTVDGQTAKVFRANFLFRGVQLPAGEHQIEFRYEPRAFYLGVQIFTFTLLLLTGAATWLWLRSRPRRSTS